MTGSRETSHYRLIMLGLLILCLISGSLTAQAQTKQLFQWSNDLKSLQSATGDELASQKAAVIAIRTNIELWLRMHPDTKVELKKAAAQPWGNDEIKNQVSALREAIEAILKEDQSRPFNLGMTEIAVTAEASPLSPMADTLDRYEIINHEAVTVAAAIDYMPGVALDRSAGRNEVGIRIRGFSNKGQIPLYLDGIPIYIPYDGTLDFARFLSSDIAEIQVAKGYSSPLLGPNNLGGSVNLVTRQPEKKFEADALIGTGSGDQLLSSLNLGSRLKHFYIQGSVDWLQRDSFPLSGNFAPNANQTTFDRNQSDARDEKYSGRVAYTPKGEDQYVFSYINQKGEKGNPPYAGVYTDSKPRYWRWPYWNKNSYYFISNTGLGETSSIKFRIFADQFRNGLDSYDDATYTTMNLYSATSSNRSSRSFYNDNAAGGSSEFNTRIIPRNSISASFFIKDDIHKEYNYYPGGKPGYETPILHDRSQQTSIGLQDVITITSKFRATVGFSADHINGREAQLFSTTAQKAISAIQCAADPTNTSFYGCTAHIWTYNPQASASYTIGNSSTLFLTFSDRSRFPLLKDSYSYGLGSAIPNPELKPEHSRNWTAGYTRTIAAKTVAQIEFFRSDLRDAIQSVYIPDPGLATLQFMCASNSTDKTGKPVTTLATYGLCRQNFNIAKEIHDGIEINVRSTPVARLTFDVSYSYLNRSINYEFDKNPNVNQINTSLSVLTALPKNKVISNITLELPRKVLVLATYRYEGGILLQDTNAPTKVLDPATSTFVNLSLPSSTSFGTADIGTVVPVYAGMSLQAGIKNLFDRNFCYTAGYPEIGRNWYVNFRYKF